MHVTIRRYQIHPGSTAELVERIQNEFVPIISQAPNFIAYYALNEGDGDISTVSIFENEGSALDSNRIASDWVLSSIGALITAPPRIISGEVVAQAGAI